MLATRASSNLSRYADWVALLVPLAVYIASLDSAVGFWDVGEMQTVPYILGIAHPTGFPAFVLLGWGFTHLIVIGSVAMRMALMCAIAMSLTAWLIARIVTEQTESPWIGIGCAWLFAFGQIAWTRGTRPEVHALAVFFVALTLYCALRWCRTSDVRFFFGGALAWGLGIATHPVVVLLGLGLFVMVIARWERLNLRMIGIAIAIFTMGVALYAYLPIRSAQVSAAQLDPTRALGIAPGRPFWDYDHPSTLAGFEKLVSGSDFDVNGGLHSIFSPQVYFTKGPAYLSTLTAEFTLLGTALALIGVVALFRRDSRLALALILAGFLSVPFALGYPPEADIQRYFLSSFVVCAVFIGIGANWLAVRARFALANQAAVGLVAVIAVFLLFTNRGVFGQGRDVRAERAIESVLRLTPKNAIVISPWIYATPLAYAAYVEHRLGDRTLDAAWLADDAALVPYWSRTRPVYVVGIVFGSVPGFVLKPLGGDPTIYAVVKQ
ncbi:MAG: DUF2723 domain-containing protein [Candidatus Eremiobacteraeota bacterium]|nr:DUF2723 domain-containing protein [Candidatus Eremiobacteraeota bacterium]